jgi:NAD(P)-dependent dehydrogenase (short-subunit alcohol dehydrogenase family)
MLARELLPHDLFAGQTVFVTGGSSGMNLGIARNFGALGAKVAICGRNVERLQGAEAVLRQVTSSVLAIEADVRDYSAMERAVEQIGETMGPIHTLVCAAAGNFFCRAEDLSPNAFRSVVEINLFGSFHASRAAFESLCESRGNIVFISAGQAYLPFSFQAHGGPAKAGMDSMMRNLALEWGHYGIRCNSVVPGPIQATGGISSMSEDEIEKGLRSATALGRLGTADEVANAVLFLASPLASYITGTRIEVDGGINLQGSAPLRYAVEHRYPRKAECAAAASGS